MPLRLSVDEYATPQKTRLLRTVRSAAHPQEWKSASRPGTTWYATVTVTGFLLTPSNTRRHRAPFKPSTKFFKVSGSYTYGDLSAALVDSVEEYAGVTSGNSRKRLPGHAKQAHHHLQGPGELA